jgi:flagellar biogenesis protein FliO
MTTSACGWPKLSHQRFRSPFWLLVLSAGIVVIAGRAGAQSQAGAQFQTDEPHRTMPSANSRAVARRPAATETPGTVAAPTEPRVAPRKTWKELARAHNVEKSRESQPPGVTLSSNDEKSHEAHTRGTSLSPMTAVSALTVVICLILILARIFRRHAPLFSQSLPTEALEILGRRFLDQRQSIVLLRIGSRILVVGSSAAGLQGVGEVTDPVEVDLIAGMCRGTRSGPGLGTSFLSLLKGQGGPQTKTRPRSEAPRRAEQRAPDPELAEEPPSARMSDPQQELMHRLRGASTTGATRSRRSEVFRE